MIDSLLNTPAISMLERTVSFTEQRHNLILANLANVDTPGYVQRDVSTSQFQAALAAAFTDSDTHNDTPTTPSSAETVAFSGNSVRLKPVAQDSAQPFYDRGAHSMEDLMSQLADNAQAHNVATTFLKNRYDVLQRAISMRA